MIKSFRHKGLKRFYETGDTSGIQFSHAKRLRRFLWLLEYATDPLDLQKYPEAYLHQLKGDRKGEWSMRISGNWRITFVFLEGDVYVLNYEDYH